MGNVAQPIDLLVAKGKKHLTKKEIEYRQKNEIKPGGQKIRADPELLQDERALREFNFLKKLYKNIEFIGTLDSHLINQYCLSVSELSDLLEAMASARSRIKDVDNDKYLEAVKLMISLDAEIRQKRAEIIKLSDRLYLNPVARTKNIPQMPKEAEDADADFFGDVG